MVDSHPGDVGFARNVVDREAGIAVGGEEAPRGVDDPRLRGEGARRPLAKLVGPGAQVRLSVWLDCPYNYSLNRIGERKAPMRMAANVARWVGRISGILQLVMGLVIWTGYVQLTQFHILNGVLLVLALWVLAGLAAGRAPVGQVVVAVVWGLLMPIFGLTQDRVLPGSFHWIIQVVHLLVGLAAIGMGEGLARAILPARASK